MRTITSHQRQMTDQLAAAISRKWFFRVTFRKVGNGDLRRMRCKPVAVTKAGTILVIDLALLAEARREGREDREALRSFRLDTVQELSACGFCWKAGRNAAAAFGAGKEAFASLEGPCANPHHQAGADAAAAWESGWKAASVLGRHSLMTLPGGAAPIIVGRGNGRDEAHALGWRTVRRGTRESLLWWADREIKTGLLFTVPALNRRLFAKALRTFRAAA